MYEMTYIATHKYMGVLVYMCVCMSATLLKFKGPYRLYLRHIHTAYDSLWEIPIIATVDATGSYQLWRSKSNVFLLLTK